MPRKPKTKKVDKVEKKLKQLIKFAIACSTKNCKQYQDVLATIVREADLAAGWKIRKSNGVRYGFDESKQDNKKYKIYEPFAAKLRLMLRKCNTTYCKKPRDKIRKYTKKNKHNK